MRHIHFHSFITQNFSAECFQNVSYAVQGSHNSSSSSLSVSSPRACLKITLLFCIVIHLCRSHTHIYTIAHWNTYFVFCMYTYRFTYIALRLYLYSHANNLRKKEGALGGSEMHWTNDGERKRRNDKMVLFASHAYIHIFNEYFNRQSNVRHSQYMRARYIYNSYRV